VSAAATALQALIGCERGDVLGADSCTVHGALWGPDGCGTAATLLEFAEHRAFQHANYGPNRDLEDGTGPEVEWLGRVVDYGAMTGGPATATTIEGLFREEWDYDRDPGQPYTWLMMLREEFAEVAAQADPEFLAGELVQLGALCASWREKILERGL